MGAWDKGQEGYKPSDKSTVIELEVELDRLQLKGARDFYNKVVGVMDKYEVTKTDRKLCMLTVQKTTMRHMHNESWMSSSLAALILTGCAMLSRKSRD